MKSAVTVPWLHADLFFLKPSRMLRNALNKLGASEKQQEQQGGGDTDCWSDAVLGQSPAGMFRQATAGPRKAARGYCERFGLAGTALPERKGETHSVALQNICKFFSALSINPRSEH